MSAAPDTEAVLRLCRTEPPPPLLAVLQQFPGQEEHVARVWFAARSAEQVSPAPADHTQRIGPYRILQPLGSGAQGDVHLARDVRTERLVALKVLRGQPTAHAIARLRHEAQAIARLRDPGIAEVLDTELSGTTPYLATRYVEGMTLRDARTSGGAGGLELFATAAVPLPAGALRWFEQLARSVHAAHLAGVVHADLHPGNIMVTPGGNPVVLDFGTAKVEGLASITHTGLALGSARFAAPEILSGKRAEVRSDVFSLGAVMADCLGLAAPGSELDSAVAAVPTPPLRAVLRKALAQVPAERFGSAAELAEELRRIRSGEPIRTGSPGLAMRLIRSMARNPLPFGAGVVLVTTLVALVVSWRWTLSARVRQDAAIAHGHALMSELAAGWSLVPVDELVRSIPAPAEPADRNALVAGVEFEVGRILRRDGRLAAARPRLLQAAENPQTTCRARFELGLLGYDLGDVSLVVPSSLAAASDHYLLGLRALLLGESDALDQLVAALARADWPDAEQRQEALLLALWLAQDEGNGPRTEGLLQRLPAADTGVVGILAGLLRGRAKIATDAEAALAELRRARWALAGRLGDAHAWTLRAERALAEALAARGELQFALRVVEDAIPRQQAVHGQPHPEVVRSQLLLWRTAVGSRWPEGIERATAALDAVEKTPGNRRLLADRAVVEASASAAPPPAPKPDHVAALEAEWQKQRVVSAEHNRRFDELVDPERLVFQREVRLKHSHFVEFPAHAAFDRAVHGETSENYLSLLIGEAESRMCSHEDVAGCEIARQAMAIVLAHPDQVDPITTLRVRSMFCKATLHARKDAGRPQGSEANRDLFDQLRQCAVALRDRIGEDDPRFLTLAKDCADSFCNYGGLAEAAEAIAFYELHRRRDPTFGPTAWVAGAALKAGDLDLAERHLTKIGELLGNRPTDHDWRWPVYEQMLKDYAQLRAAKTTGAPASDQVGR